MDVRSDMDCSMVIDGIFKNLSLICEDGFDFLVRFVLRVMPDLMPMFSWMTGNGHDYWGYVEPCVGHDASRKIDLQPNGKQLNLSYRFGNLERIGFVLEI